MKRTWLPVLVCLSLLSTSAALHAQAAAPADAAVPVAGCDPSSALPALEAAPVCQEVAPAALLDPLAGALPQAWICCTAADRQLCQQECSPCTGFAHCIFNECVCSCSSC